MNSLEESVKGKAATGRNRDLAIEDEATRLEHGEGLDHFREIARQRLLGFGLEFDLVSIAKSNAAKAVPLRLILPLLTLGNCIHRQGFHGRQRRANFEWHTDLIAGQGGSRRIG